MFKFYKFRSYKTLLFTALFFGAAAAIDLFEPLDIAITAVANKTRVHTASGEIVVVGIDDYAAKQNLTGLLPASNAVEIIESVLKGGARIVVLSEPVLASDSLDAAKLQAVLDANIGRVFITQPTSTSSKRETSSDTKYITGAVAVHNEKPISIWGGVEDVSYVIEDNGKHLVSAESILSGVHGRSGEVFTIDYAIDAHTVPFASYNDLRGASLDRAIGGKDVIIGYETSANATLVHVLGQGKYGLPTVIALGAETLKKGRTRHLSWLWSLIVAIGIGWIILSARSVRFQILCTIGSLIAAFSVVVLLNNIGISINVGHAICMVLSLAPVGVSSTLKAKVAEQSATNPDSGLASVNALWLGDPQPRPLVVASISRFEELMGLLGPAERRILTDRIASLATPNGEIWQGEDGRFYWFTRPEQSEHLASHLESLALILRNGFSIGSLPISLKAEFGVDLRFEASLSDRVLGANLSAKRAAASGKHWMAYEEGDKKEATWSVTRLRELDLAMQAGQIRADLQPKVNLRTGSVVGAEALARWTHPIRGPIKPDEFVRAAEDGGRIKELTLAVMHSALSTAKRAIAGDSDFTIAVNISPVLLTDPTLCGSVASMLALYQIEPSNLILEVTENIAFADDEVCIASMHELVDMGVRLSIDDYGTGNSTLAYLRSIPARELKIDQKFVSEITNREEDATLVQSTISLAHELNMTVVAEGVEDSRTLEKLRQMGCDVGQGYLISRPLPPEQFTQYMINLQRPKSKVNQV